MRIQLKEKPDKVQLPKAIVLGSYVNALAVTRSLGRKGIYVIMASHVRHQVGAYSRYVKEFNAVPDPYNDENGLHDLLMSKVPEWQGAIIIPTDDFYVDILSKNKVELSKYCIVLTANRRPIEIIQNKRVTIWGSQLTKTGREHENTAQGETRHGATAKSYRTWLLCQCTRCNEVSRAKGHIRDHG